MLNSPYLCLVCAYLFSNICCLQALKFSQVTQIGSYGNTAIDRF